MSRDDGLPHNWETERAVLGGLMLTGEHMEEVSAYLKADDFARPAHGRMFDLLATMHKRTGACSLTELLDEVGFDRDVMEGLGGVAYVVALPQACATVDHVPTFARRVRDHADRRRMILAMRLGEEDVGQAPPVPTGELLDATIARLAAIRDGLPGERTFGTFADHAEDLLREAQEAAETPGQVRGLTTGLADLDRMLRGLQGGRMYVVAARPAMGKSSLAQGIAHHVARRHGPVGFFSLEMDRKQMAHRAACMEGRVNGGVIETGTGGADDWHRYGRGIDMSAELQVLVDDTGGLSLGDLRTRARAMKKAGAVMIVVDYMQLVRVPGADSEERVVAEVSMGILALAKALDVPVIALAQLNRGVEGRQDKRPQMSDLRHSGQIEQDAHAVLMLYRDEVYNPDSADKGTAEILIRKHRGGPIGTVKAAFIGEFTLFQGLADRRYE